MKKSIFLFFAAILCSLSAGAATERVYFVNASNWSTINVHAWDGTATGTSWPGNPATQDTWQWEGKDVYYFEAEAGAYKKCIFNNGNGQQTADLPWTANQVYDHNSQSWLPVEVAQATTTGTTVYFVNTENWNPVNVYAFSKYPSEINNSSWPGVAATKESYQIGGFDVYSYKITKEFDYCIFNNGSQQSADLPWYQGKYYAPSKNTWYDDKAAAEEALAVPVDDVTVYFINTAGWDEVACHHWLEGGSGTSWPGDVLSKTDVIAGYDVYTATFTGEHTSCIFNNNNKGSKTGDLTVEDGKYYALSTDTWYDDKAAAETGLAAPIPDETIYFINNKDWTTINIYAWGGSNSDLNTWPGKPNMTKETEQIAGFDVYSLTAQKGSYKNFIINNGSSQSADFTWNDDKYYWIEGTATGDTKANAEAALATPVVDVYTVVGSSAPLFGETWKETKTENEMTVIEGTKYQLVKNEVSLAVDNIEYKVVINHDWNQAYPAANEILPITEAGKYNVTFTFDSNTKEVGATAELIEAAVVLPTVGVKGAWDGWAATTTLTGDNTSASATVNIATAGIYEFGLDVDGNFQASGATIDKANNSTVVTTNAGNMKLTANVLGDYTFTWTYETKTLVVTYPAGEEVEIAKKYYIAGTQNLTGFDWQVDGLEIAKVGDVYKHTFSEMSADIYEFKITDGTWTNQWGFSNLAANYVGVEQGKDGEGNPNGNIKIVTEEAKNIIVIFDPANNKITLENWEVAAPTTISYVLMGVNGDWTNGIALTQDPGNADQYVLTDQVIIKATDAIKVVTLTDGEATAWCGNVDSWSNATYTGGGEDNIVLEDGIYTFYFKKTANNIYINQTGYARNVTNTYGTICLPYAAASTTGATFYEVVGQEAGKVYLGSVNTLAAGVPYIFEKSANQIKVVYTGDKADAPVNTDANGLIGNFTNETVVPTGNYILYNNEFRKSDGEAKVNAYRAYLDFDAIVGGKPGQPMPGRRYIGMSVQGENEATGVEDLFTTDAPVKVIENGQLIIIREGVKYNVQGQVIR